MYNIIYYLLCLKIVFNIMNYLYLIDKILVKIYFVLIEFNLNILFLNYYIIMYYIIY